jgi:hypothetical protein
MTTPIRIVRLECWHSNSIIYQADGETDDKRAVYVRFRGAWFTIGVGLTEDEAVGNDVFATDAHPDADPGSITLATLKAWTAEEAPWIIWPDHIDGFNNEPAG